MDEQQTLENFIQVEMIVKAIVIATGVEVDLIESFGGWHKCSDGKEYKVGEIKVVSIDGIPV